MDNKSYKEKFKEFIEILNTIPIEGIEMMNEAGLEIKINDGKIVGTV